MSWEGVGPFQYIGNLVADDGGCKAVKYTHVRYLYNPVVCLTVRVAGDIITLS